MEGTAIQHRSIDSNKLKELSIRKQAQWYASTSHPNTSSQPVTTPRTQILEIEFLQDNIIQYLQGA